MAARFFTPFTESLDQLLRQNEAKPRAGRDGSAPTLNKRSTAATAPLACIVEKYNVGVVPEYRPNGIVKSKLPATSHLANPINEAGTSLSSTFPCAVPWKNFIPHGQLAH